MKKIFGFALLVVILLVTISFATAIGTKTTSEQKESPLYNLRTKNVISTKVTQILQNIKTKFLGERIFIIPFISFRNVNNFYSSKDQITDIVSLNYFS